MKMLVKLINLLTRLVNKTNKKLWEKKNKEGKKDNIQR